MADITAREARIGIGELAKRTATSVRALRYYEQHGLLPAVRTASGHRRFATDAIGTVRHIRLLLDAGMPLRTVSAVLACFEDETTLHPCVAGRLREHGAAIAARAAELDRQSEVLRRIQDLVEV